MRASPLSVLSPSSENSQIYMKSLSSHWIVYDRLLGQQSGSQEEKPKSSLDKGSRAKSSIEDPRQPDSVKPVLHARSNKNSKQKLLHCVTVVSPLTAALIAGPIRSTIQCFPVNCNAYLRTIIEAAFIFILYLEYLHLLYSRH